MRRLLLALLSAQPEAALGDLAQLGEAGQARLAQIAGQHRIGPMLHYRHGADPRVPEEIAAQWKAAYRQSSLQSLALRAELDAVTALLESRGFAPIALKGSWLAWQAYPDPALRPMRDIDLLLDPETVGAAQACLIGCGYGAAPAELSLEDMLRLDKHLPPLTSPRGVRIELHHRLWEVDGRMDHSAPGDAVGGPRKRAIQVLGKRYLDPADQLAHLIIHAVYDHRLDCGPLLFSDVAWLLDKAPVDWPVFWQAARAGGWLRGAWLVLELTRQQAPDLPVQFPQGEAPIPADLLRAAPDLLLQQLETRQSAGVVATARLKGPGGLWRRLTARRSGQGNGVVVVRDLAGEGGFLGWAAGRFRRTLGQLAQRDVRRQSGDLAQLSRWLESP